MPDGRLAQPFNLPNIATQFFIGREEGFVAVTNSDPGTQYLARASSLASTMGDYTPKVRQDVAYGILDWRGEVNGTQRVITYDTDYANDRYGNSRFPYYTLNVLEFINRTFGSPPQPYIPAYTNTSNPIYENGRVRANSPFPLLAAALAYVDDTVYLRSMMVAWQQSASDPYDVDEYGGAFLLAEVPYSKASDPAEWTILSSTPHSTLGILEAPSAAIGDPGTTYRTYIPSFHAHFNEDGNQLVAWMSGIGFDSPDDDLVLRASFGLNTASLTVSTAGNTNNRKLLAVDFKGNQEVIAEVEYSRTVTQHDETIAEPFYLRESIQNATYKIGAFSISTFANTRVDKTYQVIDPGPPNNPFLQLVSESSNRSIYDVVFVAIDLRTDFVFYYEGSYSTSGIPDQFQGTTYAWQEGVRVQNSQGIDFYTQTPQEAGFIPLSATVSVNVPDFFRPYTQTVSAFFFGVRVLSDFTIPTVLFSDAPLHLGSRSRADTINPRWNFAIDRQGNQWFRMSFFESADSNQTFPVLVETGNFNIITGGSIFPDADEPPIINGSLADIFPGAGDQLITVSVL